MVLSVVVMVVMVVVMGWGGMVLSVVVIMGWGGVGWDGTECGGDGGGDGVWVESPDLWLLKSTGMLPDSVTKTAAPTSHKLP